MPRESHSAPSSSANAAVGEQGAVVLQSKHRETSKLIVDVRYPLRSRVWMEFNPWQRVRYGFIHMTNTSLTVLEPSSWDWQK